MMTYLSRPVLGLLLCSLLYFPAAAAHGQAADRPSRDTLALPGLRAPVEVLRDRWGIAHLYAENEHDLFFAQGYNAARDRLFQFEMWRRRATGTMAEIFGPEAVDHDRGARLLRFRGDMQQELTHYHPRGPEIVAAFVEGVNAYIRAARANPALQPVEFEMLDIEPGFWAPEIVVSRHNGLFRNARPEIELARMVDAMGSEATKALLDLYPGDPALQPDARLDLSLLRPEILKLYNASRAPLPVGPEDVAPAYRRTTTGARATPPGARGPDDPFRYLDFISHASNNWAVTGARTFSGHALMANDPHRNLNIPALRYWVHLVAPGWNVIGGGEPALPGVSIGHNAYGAWGLTIFSVDQEDLYVYETHPDDPNRYRYGDGWEAMTIERDTIHVEGEAPVVVDLKFTRHGPVLYEDPAHHVAYALRAAWLEPGTAPYLASLRMDQATSWTQFQEACTYMGAPSENMVWAGVDGTIGWQATGITPLRQGWNGLLPVPGDGRYEWTGFLEPARLPHLENPPRGWLATANENNQPPGYAPIVGHQWDDPFRFARLAEVLDSGRRFTMMDMVQLQQDETALPARALVPLLRHLAMPDDATRDAAGRLLAWDHVVDQSSAAASIYVFWENALRDVLWERLVPPAGRDVLSPAHFSTRKMIQWLTVPDGRFGADPVAARDSLLRSALQQATTTLTARLGDDQAAWQYGRLKHARIAHPLSHALNETARARLDVGPLPRGGYRYTVNRAAWTSSTDDLNQDGGATFRIIAHTGDWDQTLGTTAPGQSGNPDSPHYRDLFRSWIDGQYFPVFYSRPKVESVTREAVLLTPAPDRAAIR